MKTMSWFAVLLAIIYFTGCASNRNAEVINDTDLLGKEDINLVFFGVLSLPLEFNNQSIWIENGPIVIAPNKNNIAYRVIDQQELNFIGAVKKPYDFFKSTFDDPSTDIELMFLEGLGRVDNKTYHTDGELEMYFIEINNSLKIYILSSALDFVVEITSEISSNKLIKKIISKAHLK
ncbi:MAG: hypothetical protein GY829_03025 [Gammaproteobacteria bacterium]|nr:hypothetical protein [Gammaproteobacteria bacterium]